MHNRRRHPEGHGASQRTAARYHLDLAGGRAVRYGGLDFGSGDNRELSRSAVERLGAAGRSNVLFSERLAFPAARPLAEQAAEL